MSPESNGVVYSKEDEHTIMLVKACLKQCQTSMGVEYKKVEKKTDRAHERIDALAKEHGERLLTLDNKDTGKVTTMWDDRKALTNSIRTALVLGVLIAGGSAYFGFRGGAKAKPTAANVEALVQLAVEKAVKETVKELREEISP